ncbi:MAG: hypothetical protein WA894_15960, partial [Candidatus Acidiferrum sp.]
VNGQGILILGAGPATTLDAPTGVAVGQQNVVGSTSYSYCVVAEDYAGGRTACSAAGSTSTGTANLGTFTTATISACTRTSGIVTCTTTAPHNLFAGSFVELSATGSNNYNGTATLLSASGSTFTFSQQGQQNDSTGVSAGTVKALAINVVQWNEVDYSVLRSYVYRCTTTCALPANAANYTLAGVTQGMDGGFLDYGYAMTASQVGNGDVPQTVPTSATADYLDTTIANGAGTTSLTLAAASTTAVSGAAVKHDNVPAVKAACTAMRVLPSNAGGGILYIPNNGDFPIHAALNFATACPQPNGSNQLEVDIGATVVASASIIPRSQMTIVGITNNGHVGNFYTMEPMTVWEGSAFPFIYALPGTSHDWSMKNFWMNTNSPYQSDILQDQDGNANNVTDIKYTNVQTNAVNAPAYIIGGGFGFFWEYGGWSTSGSSFASPPAFWDKVNYGLSKSVNSQLVGIFFTRHLFVFGGQLFDAGGQVPLSSEGAGGFFYDMLAESSFGPMVRLRLGSSKFSGQYYSLSYADFLGGAATPLIDAVNAEINGLDVFQPLCANGTQALFQSNPSGTYASVTIENGLGGCDSFGLPSYIANNQSFVNTPVLANGALGQFAYSLGAPTSAPTVVASSGGSVPTGSMTYYAAAIDANGNPTYLGPGVTINVVSGTQTVTVTPPTLPPGSIGWQPYRSGSLANVPGCTYIPGSAPFTDSFGFTCGASAPSISLAGASSVAANGLAGPQLRLTNNYADTLAPVPLSAPRTQILPDVTGIVPVTSYLNSAYDNATRANASIGSNWTMEQNGLNIASNQIQGTTTSSNTAYWTANTFSASQFSEAAITALNGTTDFPGVTVLNSGSGGTTDFYACLENSTNIYIQKVVNASSTNLTSTASTGAAGDVLRMEAAPGGSLTCYKNGAVILTFTDMQLTSGAPGLIIAGGVAALKNWSGGNLHPLGHLDVEQDWSKTQHFPQGVAFGTETFTASPRGVQSVFLPGALTATWTGSTWTLDKAVTITRVQIQAKTAPSACSTNAVVQLTNGTSPVNVTVSAAANDSGPVTQNYAAASSLTVSVQTAAAGCTTSPADANVIVQYRMQ